MEKFGDFVLEAAGEIELSMEFKLATKLRIGGADTRDFTKKQRTMAWLGTNLTDAAAGLANGQFEMTGPAMPAAAAMGGVGPMLGLCAELRLGKPQKTPVRDAPDKAYYHILAPRQPKEDPSNMLDLAWLVFLDRLNARNIPGCAGCGAPLYGHMPTLPRGVCHQAPLSSAFTVPAHGPLYLIKHLLHSSFHAVPQHGPAAVTEPGGGAAQSHGNSPTARTSEQPVGQEDPWS